MAASVECGVAQRLGRNHRHHLAVVAEGRAATAARRCRRACVYGATSGPTTSKRRSRAQACPSPTSASPNTIDPWLAGTSSTTLTLVPTAVGRRHRAARGHQLLRAGAGSMQTGEQGGEVAAAEVQAGPAAGALGPHLAAEAAPVFRRSRRPTGGRRPRWGRPRPSARRSEPSGWACRSPRWPDRCRPGSRPCQAWAGSSSTQPVGTPSACQPAGMRRSAAPTLITTAASGAIRRAR